MSRWLGWERRDDEPEMTWRECALCSLLFLVIPLLAGIAH